MPTLPPSGLRRRTLALAAAALTLAATAPALAQQQYPYRQTPAPYTSEKEYLNPQVLIQTSMGNITLELNRERAPKTVENFLKYVKDKHYDGTIFHRVIDGFMIQGGGLTEDMKTKPVRDPILLESRNGLLNDAYTVAMARTAYPHSATAQFFINVVDNANLNAPKPDGYGYTVFGKVTAGREVVDSIRTVPTHNRGMHQNVPIEPITILKAEEIFPGKKPAEKTSEKPEEKPASTPTKP